MPVHFLLRDKLSSSVLNRLARTAGEGGVCLGFQIDEMQLPATYRGDGAPIRGEVGIDPILSRQFRDAAV